MGMLVDVKRFHLTSNQLAILERERHVTTCEPKMRLERMSPGVSAELVDYLGQKVALYDESDRPAGYAWLEAAFETTYADPHPYLVSGMGFEADILAFKKAYRGFWAASFPGEALRDGTIL